VFHIRSEVILKLEMMISPPRLLMQLCSPFSLQLLPTNHLLSPFHTHMHGIIIGDEALAGEPFEYVNKQEGEKKELRSTNNLKRGDRSGLGDWF